VLGELEGGRPIRRSGPAQGRSGVAAAEETAGEETAAGESPMPELGQDAE
jgi:hypothetical protein